MRVIAVHACMYEITILQYPKIYNELIILLEITIRSFFMFHSSLTRYCFLLICYRSLLTIQHHKSYTKNQTTSLDEILEW